MYVVGRDWPDQLYATNASWPVANIWHYRPKYVVHRKQTPHNEVQQAYELGVRRELKKQVKELKRQLFKGILDGDIALVKSLLRRSTPLLERHTQWGATPVALAAATGNVDLLQLLLDEGACITAQDSVGATPLITAAYHGKTEAVLCLLASKQGGNAGREFLLRQTTRSGETALLAAAKAGHMDTLKALKAAGACTAVRDSEGVNSLMAAARFDRVAVLQWLMSADGGGLSPHALDATGRNALMHAAAGAALQAVQLLLPTMSRATAIPAKAPALHTPAPPATVPRPPPHEVPALHSQTAVHSQAAVQQSVHVPVQAQAAVRAGGLQGAGTPSTPSGLQPLAQAEAASSTAAAGGASPQSPMEPTQATPAVVQMRAPLPQSPPPPSRPPPSPPPPPLSQQQQQQQPMASSPVQAVPLQHVAVQGLDVQAVPLQHAAVQGLDVQGASLYHADAEGRTALHHAVTGGSVSVMEALTTAGLRVQPNDAHALPMLLLACASGHVSTVDWLLKQQIGANVLTLDANAHPLFVAVKHSHAGVIEALLAHGSRLDVRDSKGRTPLALAAVRGDAKMVGLLVSKGADLLAADTLGRVPRRLAYERNQRKASQVLSQMARDKYIKSDYDPELQAPANTPL